MVSENSSSALQWQMQRIRGKLVEHADEALQRTRRTFDWRHFVAKHPWSSLGAAAALGFFLVPRHACAKSANTETVTEAVDRVARAVQPSPLAGVVSGVLSAVTATIAREGLDIAAQSVRQLFEPHEPL